ncbi:hypothetical protein BKA67DRAFT_536437 [Truncatella angustata]|uniref:Uncharacterized protein n=1 Tax=Truncatella angustata TaxID=152316 RepID=A0A9P8ZX73_9PEZI|nr:uncharacterized protein BKA67DRAFT_536437 [Truncatella angustata]KAH6652714.1 hypothetical protein BKA67DRAFT_536437 [Truncatella angustata]
MASSNPRQRRFLSRPLFSDGDSTPPELAGGGRRKKRKRDANVYDAVAGRVTTTHALEDGSDSETFRRRRKRTTLRDSTLAPEEVLFQRAGAPIRYAEKDIYNSHEWLPHGGRGILPDNDMLKAIHSYSSHFYSALTRTKYQGDEEPEERNIDERSMDETALLAFGVLLEEAGRNALGRRGDLVFTEGMEAGTEGQSSFEESQPVRFLDVDLKGRIPKRVVGKAAEEARNRALFSDT